MKLSAGTKNAENKADMKPQQETGQQTAEIINAEHNIKEIGRKEHGDYIQAGRGLSDTESGDAGRTGRDADEVRDALEDIPKGTPFGDILREAPVGQTDRALPDDTEAGRGTGRQAQDSYFMEMSWNETESGISKLINDGEYLNSNEAFLLDAAMRDEIAENIYCGFGSNTPLLCSVSCLMPRCLQRGI